MNELKTGDVLKDRYRLVYFIGNGSFGEVWLAEDLVAQRNVAIKIYMSLDPEGIAEFQHEYGTAIELRHPYLLTPDYFDVVNRRPFLVMKYCEGGSSSKLIGRITEEQLWQFIHDVASGLAFLHSKGVSIVHQDIKPDNILIDHSGKFLITDFGISKQLKATMRKQSRRDTSSGTIPYMAPERFEASPKLATASDIWSLGASIYELATGELPFSGFGGTMQKNGAEMPSIRDNYSFGIDELMRRCMDLDPSKRPTAAELREWCKNKNVSRPSQMDVTQNASSATNLRNCAPPTVINKKSGKNRSFVGLGVFALFILIGLTYLFDKHTKAADVSEHATIRIDSVAMITDKAADTTQSVLETLETKNKEDVKTFIFPRPGKSNKNCKLPLDPAGCPYIYVKGSDREGMIKGKYLKLNLYGREYAFSIGNDHPNSIKAEVIVNSYSTSAFEAVSQDYWDEITDDFDDLKDENDMQMTIMDLDGNGECELLFSVRSGEWNTMKTYIYKILPSPYKYSILKYMGVADGQLGMYIEDNSIIAPIGFQGYFNQYIISPNDRIINVNE